MTTPGAPELQATLAAMVAERATRRRSLETTSHALELDRVAGVAYDAAVFTNLTHEHLDLHGTFERYRAAKLRLFAALAQGPANPAKTVAGRPWPKLAIINRDDPAASWFEASAREAGATVLTYGTDPAADVRATAVEEDARRLRVGYAAASAGEGPWSSAWPAGSTSTTRSRSSRSARASGWTPPPSARASSRSRASRAGWSASTQGQPFGGDRRLRPLAGVARGRPRPARADRRRPRRRADRRVRLGRRARHRQARRDGQDRRASAAASSSRPTRTPAARTPTAIVDEIVRGAEAAGPAPGRRRRSRSRTGEQAIAAAFERARPGDVVLLAGKGHEPTILYADHALPWDEAAVARGPSRPWASTGCRLMRGCLFTLALGRRPACAPRGRRPARGRRGRAHGRAHRRRPPVRRHDRDRVGATRRPTSSGCTPTACGSWRPTRRSATSRSAAST